jgi:predicted ATPase
MIDDLHAADAPSLLLLAFVAGELRTARVLLVATHHPPRPDLDPRRAALLADLARGAQRIHLGGFNEGEVGEYPYRAFGVEPEAAVVRAVHQTTDGNPFFVDEVGRVLAATGRLDSARRGSVELHVPDNVKALIRRRLAPLDDRTRRVLAIAAVAGRTAGLGVLEAASGLARPRLLESIAAARAADLVREVSGALGRYTFSHGLVRDTLYEDLDEPQRVRVHLRIAEALEELHEVDLDPHLGEIAHHYSRAALPGQLGAQFRFDIPTEADGLVFLTAVVGGRVVATAPDLTDAEGMVISGGL